MKCDAATLGNHDYDNGHEFLDKIMSEADFPYLISNAFDTEMPSGKFHETQEPYKIFEIPTKDKNNPVIKIGVIGCTYNFPKSMAFLKPNEEFSEVKLDEYLPKIIEYSDILKKEGVDSIILLIHTGFSCKNQSMTYGIYSPDDKATGCGQDAESLLENLPEGTIDAILASHSHKENHAWVNGIPVLSGTNQAKNSNVLYLAFDRKTFKFDSKKVRIEGPLPACEKIFSGSKNCNAISSKSNDPGELQDYKFHG